MSPQPSSTISSATGGSSAAAPGALRPGSGSETPDLPPTSYLRPPTSYLRPLTSDLRPLTSGSGNGTPDLLPASDLLPLTSGSGNGPSTGSESGDTPDLPPASDLRPLTAATSPSSADAWDLIIRPHAGWFDLHLEDLWRYRDLVTLFVRRDFVAQFKQTILGPAWFVLQPLLTTVMFTVVFGNIAKLSTDGLPKTLFYLSGNVLWGYFAGCLTSTSSTFVANAGLFGKVYFPRLAVPVSIIISQLLKLGLQFLIFLALFGFFAIRGADIRFTWAALLLPGLVLLMALLALGMGIIISAMTTKYRDLQFLLGFGVQLAMYTTTVIYPLSSIGGGWIRYFVLANPMTPIIEVFRYGFLGTGVFNWWHLGYSAAFTAVMLLIGIVIFTRVERTFMDTV